MNQEVLLTFGEVGVALAGFSGIVVTLGRRASGDWTDQDRLRLRDMLFASLGVAVFGFLPVVLSAAGMSDRVAYQHSSAALFLYLVFGTAVLLRGGTGRLGVMAFVMAVPTVFVVLMLGLVAFDVIFRVAAFAYLLALFWLVILSAANFGRLLIGAKGT